MSSYEFDFFICHAVEEYYIAKEFQKLLDQLGLKSFVAHKSIPKGEDWHLKIIEKIQNSKYIIIIATENLNNRSQYCHYEIGYADAITPRKQKFIFFLDDIDFLPHMCTRIQGYKIDEKNIEEMLNDFIIDIGIKEFDKQVLGGIKEGIFKYITKPHKAKNILRILNEGNHIGALKYIPELDEKEKGKLTIGIIKDLKMQKQDNLIGAVETLFSVEKSKNVRTFIIREIFDLINSSEVSEGQLDLLRTLSKMPYRPHELDFIKDNYLNDFIKFFCKATRSFAIGNDLSKFLVNFKGKFDNFQLKGLYIALLSNAQINGQDFSFKTQSRSTIKQLLNYQNADIPEIIEEMDNIEKKGIFDAPKEKRALLDAVEKRYPDIFNFIQEN